MSERKHITMDTWTDSFDKIACPGDTVDEEIVDHFMNILPPASMSPGYLQSGGPFAHVQDKDGRWRPTYATFRKDGDVWVWCGNCFRGSTEHISDNGDPWKERDE